MANNPPPQSENAFNPKMINENQNNQNKEIKEEPQQTTEVVIFKDQKEMFDKPPNEQNQPTETDKNNDNKYMFRNYDIYFCCKSKSFWTCMDAFFLFCCCRC